MVENSEKTYDMLKSKFKNSQNGHIKAQFQKKPQNQNSNAKPNYQNNQQFNKNGNNYSKQNNYNKNKSDSTYQKSKNPQNPKNNPKNDNSKQKCHRCGYTSHKVKDCVAKRHVNGDILPQLSKNSTDPNTEVNPMDQLGFFYDDFEEICQLYEISDHENILEPQK